jgi:hypothetical protein
MSDQDVAMKVVQVRCPFCRTGVVLTARSFAILVLPRDGRPGRVAFACPECSHTASVPADAEIVFQLRAQGCPLVRDLVGRAQLPWGQRAGRGEVAVAAPVGLDDLLDFHMLLARGDWFDQLLAVISEENQQAVGKESA